MKQEFIHIDFMDNLLKGPSSVRHRHRESALRDSLHFSHHSNKLKRISSIAPGLGMPHFSRKIFSPTVNSGIKAIS